MKNVIIIVVAVSLIGLSCGARKGFVEKLVADSESRTSSRIDALSSRADSTAAEVERLGKLSLELESKSGLTVNQASGFEDYIIVWKGEITFAFDQADIDDIASSIIGEAAARLAQTNRSIIEIAGHCDATGNRTYNYLLGERRANAAKRYLADRYGIALYRMFIISFGKDKPVALPDERSANARNRRVALQIWAPRLAEQSK